MEGERIRAGRYTLTKLDRRIDSVYFILIFPNVLSRPPSICLSRCVCSHTASHLGLTRQVSTLNPFARTWSWVKTVPGRHSPREGKDLRRLSRLATVARVQCAFPPSWG